MLWFLPLCLHLLSPFFIPVYFTPFFQVSFWLIDLYSGNDSRLKWGCDNSGENKSHFSACRSLATVTSAPSEPPPVFLKVNAPTHTPALCVLLSAIIILHPEWVVDSLITRKILLFSASLKTSFNCNIYCKNHLFSFCLLFVFVCREMGLWGADLLSGADADWLVYAQLSLQPGGTYSHMCEQTRKIVSLLLSSWSSFSLSQWLSNIEWLCYV